MENNVKLTEKEVEELIVLYKQQIQDLKIVRLERDMYKEWSLSYKREIEELKKVVEDYKLEYQKLIDIIQQSNERDEVLEEDE